MPALFVQFRRLYIDGDYVVYLLWAVADPDIHILRKSKASSLVVSLTPSGLCHGTGIIVRIASSKLKNESGGDSADKCTTVRLNL